MTNLKATSPYFVRCVNPNRAKSNKIFNVKHVENQLRCGGIIEALRVLKLGYPTRVSYEIIYAKYQPHIENELIHGMAPDKFAAAILIAFGVNPEEYELGLTKIFFRPAKAAVLDEIMEQADNLSEEQYKRILDWLAQTRATQLIGALKVHAHFQKVIRDTRALNRWKKSGRIAGHVGSLVRYLEVARKQIEERKRNNAATTIQSYYKAYIRRVALQKKLRKHNKAIKKVWKAHIGYQQRNEFMKWLAEKVEITREIERKRREEEERKRREEEARRKREEEERKKREAEEKIREEERRKREEAQRLELAAAKEEERIRLMAEQAEAERRRQKEEEERRIREEEERKIREEEDRKRREEEERLRKEEEDRKRREEEEERKRKLAEEERLRAERKAKELVDAKEAEDKKKQELLAVDEARRKHRTHSQYVNKKVAEQKKKDAMREKKRKINRIDNEIEDRYEVEEDARQKRRDANIEKDIMVRRSKAQDYDYSEDSSSDIGYDFGSGTEVDFKRIAQNGTLFMKHTGRRRNRAPQDRFVKVTFDDRGKPLRISWGSGSRHLDFSEIKLIAWGAYSPTFVARQNELDPRSCFSIVSHHSILDLQNPDRRTVETWVHGLRDLIAQTDEEAKQLQTELRENPPIPKREDAVGQRGSRSRRRRESRRESGRSTAPKRGRGGDDSGGGKPSRSSRRESKRRPSSRFVKPEKEHKKRTKSLMLLQQDLFVMTTTTVFRNLEEENYPITQTLKDTFNPKEMYELALKNDVPWRQWQNWIREQIISRMVQEGLVQNPVSSAGSSMIDQNTTIEGAMAMMADEVNIGETPGRDRAGTQGDCVLS